MNTIPNIARLPGQAVNRKDMSSEEMIRRYDRTYFLFSRIHTSHLFKTLAQNYNYNYPTTLATHSLIHVLTQAITQPQDTTETRLMARFSSSS